MTSISKNWYIYGNFLFNEGLFYEYLRTASCILFPFCSLDMMDRVEAPSITDGYGLSLAFLAMLDVTRCVQVQPHFITAKPIFSCQLICENCLAVNVLGEKYVGYLV